MSHNRPGAYHGQPADRLREGTRAHEKLEVLGYRVPLSIVEGHLLSLCLPPKLLLLGWSRNQQHQSVSFRNTLEVQSRVPTPAPPVSERALSQDTQVIGVHMKV